MHLRQALFISRSHAAARYIYRTTVLAIMQPPQYHILVREPDNEPEACYHIEVASYPEKTNKPLAPH
ncbi:MAG TPA: hypothetical protein VH593_26475, partial [Ktedonobacteraceae bacterium]